MAGFTPHEYSCLKLKMKQRIYLHKVILKVRKKLSHNHDGHEEHKTQHKVTEIEEMQGEQFLKIEHVQYLQDD